MPPSRRRGKNNPFDALEKHEQALLQGQWDAGQFGVATVIGCKVSYSSLDQKFDLFRTKDDNLLVLGEYRASLHNRDIYWRIPGDPSEEIVHWAKLETEKIEVPDSDDNQETTHGTEVSTGTGTCLLDAVAAMQPLEKVNMQAAGGDDQSPQPKRQKNNNSQCTQGFVWGEFSTFSTRF